MKEELEKIKRDEEDQIIKSLKSKYSASKRYNSSLIGVTNI